MEYSWGVLLNVPSHNINKLNHSQMAMKMDMEKRKQSRIKEIEKDNKAYGMYKKKKTVQKHPVKKIFNATRIAAAGLTALLLSPQNYDMPEISGYRNLVSNVENYFENAQLSENSNNEIIYRASHPDFQIPAMIPEIPMEKHRELKQDLKNAFEKARNATANYANRLKNSVADFFYRFGNLEGVVLNEQKSNLYDAAVGENGEIVEEEQEEDESILEEFISEGKKVFVQESKEMDYSRYMEKPYKFDKTKVFSLAKAMQENPEGVYGTLIAEEIKKFDPSIRENRGRIISLERTMRKAEREIPEVKHILDQYNVEEEMAVLPIIESGWKKDAVSEKEALGLWQFMEETAQRYGLKIVREILGYDTSGKKIEEIVYDERLNPILSTKAAAKYLSDLEKTLCNTDLAIKAFNGGSGKFKPFVDENNCKNISLMDFFAFRGEKIVEWYTNVKIKKGYTLSKIMGLRGIPWKNRSEIMNLNGMKNPKELKVGQVLYIPFEFAERFGAKTPESILENVEYIAKHKAMMHVLKTQYPEFYSIKPSNGFGVHVVSKKPMEYTVQKGDFPWKIAEKYARGGYKELTRNIKLINGIVDEVGIGRVLNIPRSTTLADFAFYNGHGLKELKGLNPQIPDPYMELPDGAGIVYPSDERAQQI